MTDDKVRRLAPVSADTEALFRALPTSQLELLKEAYGFSRQAGAYRARLTLVERLLKERRAAARPEPASPDDPQDNAS